MARRQRCQRPINCSRRGRHKKHALPSGSKLGDDLCYYPGLSCPGKPLDQANVRRVQCPGDRVSLYGVELAIVYCNRLRIRGRQSRDLARQCVHKQFRASVGMRIIDGRGKLKQIEEALASCQGQEFFALRRRNPLEESSPVELFARPS